jgi:hypothetical protein
MNIETKASENGAGERDNKRKTEMNIVKFNLLKS